MWNVGHAAGNVDATVLVVVVWSRWCWGAWPAEKPLYSLSWTRAFVAAVSAGGNPCWSCMCPIRGFRGWTAGTADWMRSCLMSAWMPEMWAWMPDILLNERRITVPPWLVKGAVGKKGTSKVHPGNDQKCANFNERDCKVNNTFFLGTASFYLGFSEQLNISWSVNASVFTTYNLLFRL